MRQAKMGLRKSEQGTAQEVCSKGNGLCGGRVGSSQFLGTGLAVRFCSCTRKMPYMKSIMTRRPKDVVESWGGHPRTRTSKKVSHLFLLGTIHTNGGVSKQLYRIWRSRGRSKPEAGLCTKEARASQGFRFL